MHSQVITLPKGYEVLKETSEYLVIRDKIGRSTVVPKKLLEEDFATILGNSLTASILSNVPLNITVFFELNRYFEKISEENLKNNVDYFVLSDFLIKKYLAIGNNIYENFDNRTLKLLIKLSKNNKELKKILKISFEKLVNLLKELYNILDDIIFHFAQLYINLDESFNSINKLIISKNQENYKLLANKWYLIYTECENLEEFCKNILGVRNLYIKSNIPHFALTTLNIYISLFENILNEEDEEEAIKSINNWENLVSKMYFNEKDASQRKAIILFENILRNVGIKYIINGNIENVIKLLNNIKKLLRNYSLEIEHLKLNIAALYQ